MKKALLLVIVACLILVVTGCNTAPTQEADGNFNFIFKYGVTAGNTLDTFNGTYTKDMILDPSVTIDLTLTAEEMDSIHQKMLEIGFFNYPDEFYVDIADNEIITLVTPYLTYFFLVEYNGNTKELLWHDKYINSDTQADKLKELINLIIGIIESKDVYKALPEPSGGYL